MKYSHRSPLLALLLSAALIPSTIAKAVVDGSGNAPGSFTSITDAMASVVAGGTVDIIGMVDSSGNPVGYSQTPFFSGQAREFFPISVPPGVAVRQLGSTPVYIWDSFGGAAPTDLFTLSRTTTTQLTRFVNLTLMGGNVAINATVQGVGFRSDCLVQ